MNSFQVGDRVKLVAPHWKESTGTIFEIATSGKFYVTYDEDSFLAQSRDGNKYAMSRSTELEFVFRPVRQMDLFHE